MSLLRKNLLSDSYHYPFSSDATEVPTGGRQDPDIGIKQEAGRTIKNLSAKYQAEATGRKNNS